MPFPNICFILHPSQAKKPADSCSAAAHERPLSYRRRVSARIYWLLNRGCPVDPGDGEITQLLNRWTHGDRASLDLLAPLVESELRRIAGSYLRRERPSHT